MLHVFHLDIVKEIEMLHMLRADAGMWAQEEAVPTCAENEADEGGPTERRGRRRVGRQASRRASSAAGQQSRASVQTSRR